VQPTLLELLAKYPQKVRIVYKDLPLPSLHPQAHRASEAGRCARDQNKFWEFHDRVFAGNPDSSAEYLRKLATEAGLNVPAFESCLASGKHNPGIQVDIDEGAQLGITGTPAFFINGRELSGAQPIEVFVKMIDEELQSAGSR
jgi:protein-disulfide isomerase